MLWLLFVILAATVIVSQPVAGPELATISVDPLIRDTRNLVKIGETFSINITVAGVTDLWGYDFRLYYNTTILELIDTFAYPPLDKQELPPVSNETAGYVWMSWAARSGAPAEEGLTAVDPKSVAKVDFRVDANGTTGLDFDLYYTNLVDVYGDVIALQVADGRFSNTELLLMHDIAVTNVAVSPTSVEEGGLVTIDAVVANHGDFNETFNVKAYYNVTADRTETILYNETHSELDIFLTTGGTRPVSFTWNTTDVSGDVYLISVEAVVVDEGNPIDNTGTATVTVKGKPTTYSPTLYLIVAVVVVIAAAGVGVYLLRKR